MQPAAPTKVPGLRPLTQPYHFDYTLTVRVTVIPPVKKDTIILPDHFVSDAAVLAHWIKTSMGLLVP